MIYGHCENSAREFFYIDLSQLKYIFFYKPRDSVRVVGGSDAVGDFKYGGNRICDRYARCTACDRLNIVVVVPQIGFIIYDSWQYIVFYCSKWMSNIFVKQY